MKKTTLITLFILLIAFSHGQINPSTVNDKTTHADIYRLRAKNFRIAGFACVGAGALCMSIGYATIPKDYFTIFGPKSSHEQEALSATMFIIGNVAMITGIVMFVNSAGNSHRAKVSIQKEELSGNIPIKMGRSFTALSLNISLGKHH